MSRGKCAVALAVVLLLAATAAAYPAGKAKLKRHSPKAASGYVPAARKALDALHGLESIVKVGVILTDYSHRVGDAQIVVDRFLRAYPNDPLPPSRAQIGAAMSTYAYVLSNWNFQIQHDADPELLEPQKFWGFASEHIAAAEKALAAKPKTKAPAKHPAKKSRRR